MPKIPSSLTYMRCLRGLFIIFLLQAIPGFSAEAPDHLPGLWQQFDDKTGKLQALVRIGRNADGSYRGVVEKIIPEPGEDPNPKCDKCRDKRHDQPVLGMEIISRLKRSDETVYTDGEILDPDEGDTYRLKITVLDQGARLDVRGYLGISLFGRSQIWTRAKSQN